MYFAIISHGTAVDDAHITMRVVRNALEGRGLRYNEGDMGVQVATSPLNLLAMLTVSWILRLLGIPAEAAALTAPVVILSLALPAMGIGAYLLMLGDKRQSFLAAAAATFLMAVPLGRATIGLETILGAALCFAALLAYRKQKWKAMSWLLGLAFLARHDAAILAGILFLLTWRETKKDPSVRFLPLILGFIMVAVPWLIFSVLYYGVTTPTTLASKMSQGGTVYWPAPYYELFWPWIKTYFLNSAVLAGLVAVLALIGVVLGLRSRTRASSAVLVFVLHQALIFLAYVLLRMPDYYWYFVPYAIAMVLSAGWLLANFGEIRLPAKIAGWAAVAAVLIAAASMRALPSWGGGPLESYREVGRYIVQHPPRVAAGLMEIGIIGFYAPGVRVFDFAGVASLDQAKRVSENRAHEWLSDPSVADVVVIRGVKHPLEPDIDNRFERLYRHEWDSPPSLSFPKGVQIWRLKP